MGVVAGAAHLRGLERGLPVGGGDLRGVVGVDVGLVDVLRVGLEGIERLLHVAVATTTAGHLLGLIEHLRAEPHVLGLHPVLLAKGGGERVEHVGLPRTDGLVQVAKTLLEIGPRFLFPLAADLIGVHDLGIDGALTHQHAPGTVRLARGLLGGAEILLRKLTALRPLQRLGVGGQLRGDGAFRHLHGGVHLRVEPATQGLRGEELRRHPSDIGQIGLAQRPVGGDSLGGGRFRESGLHCPQPRSLSEPTENVLQPGQVRCAVALRRRAVDVGYAGLHLGQIGRARGALAKEVPILVRLRRRQGVGRSRLRRDVEIDRGRSVGCSRHGSKDWSYRSSGSGRLSYRRRGDNNNRAGGGLSLGFSRRSLVVRKKALTDVRVGILYGDGNYVAYSEGVNLNYLLAGQLLPDHHVLGLRPAPVDLELVVE